MNVEIIAVGSELLLGQIVNSNARFLSEKLAGIGANVYFHTVVGDNPRRLRNVLEVASERSDCLILTGGLGPTKDDLTRNIVADFVGTTLEVNDEALRKIKDFFEIRGVFMTDNNVHQATVLSGAEIFPNDNGLAVGMAYEFANGKTVILLPGPPSEMIPMYNNHVKSYIEGKISGKHVIKSRVLRFFGIGESTLETKIIHLIDNQTNPTVAPLAQDGEVTLRLTASATSVEKTTEMLNEIEEQIQKIVGDYFYGYDDSSLISEFVNTVKEMDLKVSIAESLTGGALQGQLTELGGSSKYFSGGIVTYSTESKVNILGVSEKTVSDHGVVSSKCAEEMADRVREIFGTDVGISLTGVAGPDELEGKQVGTVYVGLSLGDTVTSKKLQLGNRRNLNIILSSKHALKFAIDELRK